MRVVVDAQFPPEKLLAEIMRQSDRYAYAEILGLSLLFAREPRYRLRANANIVDVPRFDGVLHLSRDHGDFRKSGWAYGGSFLGGTSAHNPLIQDKVTLTPSAEVIEQFVQFL